MPEMRPLTMTRSCGTPLMKVRRRSRRNKRSAPRAEPFSLPMNAKPAATMKKSKQLKAPSS